MAVQVGDVESQVETGGDGKLEGIGCRDGKLFAVAAADPQFALRIAGELADAESIAREDGRATARPNQMWPCARVL